MKAVTAHFTLSGTNTTGEGTKRFWAQTHELRMKLAELAARIKELEDALAASYVQSDAIVHPLLSPSSLQIKEPYIRYNAAQALSDNSVYTPPVATRESLSPPASIISPRTPSAQEDALDDVVETFGSLAINESGRTTYSGPTAWSSVSIALPSAVSPA
jgi:hypothetical protein